MLIELLITLLELHYINRVTLCYKNCIILLIEISYTTRITLCYGNRITLCYYDGNTIHYLIHVALTELLYNINGITLC